MTIKIYMVGGAVRDHLMGRKPKDKDYVVVGADVGWMLARGFKQVGASFPVFLHPETGDEYALARRERKVAPGYQGFEIEFGPHVTLEDDLIRRDLTVNAMAMDTDGNIIDLFGGCHDIAQGVLRHTSDAFAEDPLRVMRLARFRARYGFIVAEESRALCQKLVNSGELDTLSADRIWGELEKMMSEPHASWGLKFLEEVGALNTKRLKGFTNGLLDFDRVYEPGFEGILTTDDRIYLSLCLYDMDKREIEVKRVPLEVVKRARFMRTIHDVFVMRFVFDTLELDDVIDVIDRHRDELRQGRFDDAVVMLERILDFATPTVMWPKVQVFLDEVKQAISAQLGLDLTEVTAGLPVKEIKAAVRQAKRDAIKNLFVNKLYEKTTT